MTLAIESWPSNIRNRGHERGRELRSLLRPPLPRRRRQAPRLSRRLAPPPGSRARCSPRERDGRWQRRRPDRRFRAARLGRPYKQRPRRPFQRRCRAGHGRIDLIGRAQAGNRRRASLECRGQRFQVLKPLLGHDGLDAARREEALHPIRARPVIVRFA